MTEQQFKQLLQNHSDMLGDRKKFVGLLKDYIPDQPLQRNLLLYLYDFDIHIEISKAAQLNNAFAYRFVKRLCDDNGVSKINAEWAVRTWCACYGSILGKDFDIIPNADNNSDVNKTNAVPLTSAINNTAMVFDNTKYAVSTRITSNRGSLKNKAIALCRQNGLYVGGKITFASKNRGSNKYWANPSFDVLQQNWWLLLDDNNNGNLHVFNVPANSIPRTALKPRNDKQHQIDLQIYYNDQSFEDSRSGVKFDKWLVKTISYNNANHVSSNNTPRQFFVNLYEHIKNNGMPLEVKFSGGRQWCWFINGRVKILAELLQRENKIRIGFYMTNAHAIYDELILRKQDIENELGHLEWIRKTPRGDRTSRIITYLYNYNEDNVADSIMNFVRVFQPIFTEIGAVSGSY